MTHGNMFKYTIKKQSKTIYAILVNMQTYGIILFIS